MNWIECLSLTQDINNHYGMKESQYRLIYDIASKMAEGNIFLELGVCHGRSAATLAYVANNIGAYYYGIDNFSLEGSLEEVQSIFQTKGLHGTIINSNTHSADWQLPVDLLFIDAGHDVKNVSVDCELYIPLIKSNGYVLFDDWDEPFDYESPHWAVHAYGESFTRGWEECAFDRGLKIKRKPE